MSNELIKKLKQTRKIGNIILAGRIAKITYPIQSEKDFEKDHQNREKAYELFLKLIDDHSRKNLIDLDYLIRKLTQSIENQSGWWDTDVGFMYMDRCHSSAQRDLSAINTYVVVRTNHGYEPSSRSFSTGELSLISSREERFCEYFEEPLKEIHELYCKKDEILDGSYTLKDPSSEELAISIAQYLKSSNRKFQEEKKTSK